MLIIMANNIIYIIVGEPCKPFQKLVVKGCGDHLCNLVSKEFERRAAILGIKQWGLNDLQSGSPSGPYKTRHTWLMKRISKRFGSGKWKSLFQGMVAHFNYATVPIPRVTSTRFISTDAMSTNVATHFPLFCRYYKSMGTDLTEKDQEDFAALKNMDVQNLIYITSVGARYLLQPIMARLKNINTKEAYSSLIGDLVAKAKQMLLQKELRRAFFSRDEYFMGNVHFSNSLTSETVQVCMSSFYGINFV